MEAAPGRHRRAPAHKSARKRFPFIIRLMTSVKVQAVSEAGAALNIQAVPMCRKCDDAGGTSNKLAAYRISLRYGKQLRYVTALPAAQDAPSPRIGPDTWHSKAPSYESVMGTSVQSEAHRRAIYRRYHGKARAADFDYFARSPSQTRLALAGPLNTDLADAA